MFSIQNNFCKKGGGGEVIVVIGVLHGMKVKLHLLRRIFFFPFLPTGVLYGMKVKCNLMRQIYKRHLAIRIFFLSCKKSHFIFFEKTS